MKPDQSSKQKGIIIFGQYQTKKATMTRRTREKLTSASVTSSHLSQISEVVSLHFEVKHLTFCVTGLWNEVFVQETLKKAKIQVFGVQKCIQGNH